MYCSVMDCESKVFTKGMCSKHHQRMKRHGDTSTLLGRGGKPRFTMPI